MHARGPWRGRRVRGALALGLTLLTIACSTPTPPPTAPASKPAGAVPAAQPASPPVAPAPPAQLHPFQLGVVAFVSYFYPMWIAIEKGFGAQQGLDIEMTTFQTNEAVAALVSGSLDVLMCPTDSCVTALSKGATIKQLNDYLIEAPYDLIAKPEIASVAELRGKKV